MNLGHVQQVNQAQFGKSGSNLLKVWYTEGLSLLIDRPKLLAGAERFHELLLIGRLVLSMVKTGQAEVVMKQVAQWKEDLAPERL